MTYMPMNDASKILKGNLAIDPRGLIFEAYRIDGVTDAECRTIFLDWAMGANVEDMSTALQTLLGEYQSANPDHPMTAVIKEGLSRNATPRRRGGRLGKRV